MKTNDFKDQLIEEIPRLKSFALKLTKNSTKAEEVLQDTLYKALKYQDRFELGTSLSAWLMTIMKNTFYDSTDSRRKLTYKNTTYFSELFDSSLLNHSVDNKALEVASIEVILKLIDELDDKHKAPLQFYLKGFKYQEIADRLNSPLGSIKFRLFTAKSILREKLTSLGY